MDKILHFVFKIYKRIRPPKRLYKYGTIGLSAYDDRTNKEKFFDSIDEFFFEWEQRQRYKKAYRKQVFHSYFDFGLGKMVTSNEEIRNKEKQGYVYTTFNEMEKESDRIRARNAQQEKEHAKKYFREGISRIRSGNSNYHQQLMQKYSQK